MMTLKKFNHILRAVNAITNEKTFVVIGSAAIIARARRIPPAMLQTNEVDLYAPNAEDPEKISDLIQGTLGFESPFHQTFDYAADGVSSNTAVMPRDWNDRAMKYQSAECPNVVAIIPDPNDIAIAKMAAWREKDRDWLILGANSGIISTTKMASLLENISTDFKIDTNELRRRLTFIANSVIIAKNTGKGPAD